MEKKSGTCPVCGMNGTLHAHGKVFCSERCVREYEKQKGILKGLYCPECAKGHGMRGEKKWYHERLYQSLMLLAALMTAHLLLTTMGFPVLSGFWSVFYDYLMLIWWAVLLGFVIGGFIDYIIPNTYISKFLFSPEKRTIGYSVLLGFLMSACSHGILAISMELYRKGASVPAVISFLLASPWANLPITILLFGFFGTNALLFILSAVAVALATGVIFQALDRKGWIERTKHAAHVSPKFSVRADMMDRWKTYRKNPDTARAAKGILRGSWSLAKMVMWWLIVGMIAASFARAFITPELFHAYLGPTVLGLVITLIIATIIEVCSEGSSPVAFEIYKQTGALGNSFTFLMAGVATDYTEVGLIASNIGRRAAILLPIVTVPQILLLGYAFNMIL